MSVVFFLCLSLARAQSPSGPLFSTVPCATHLGTESGAGPGLTQFWYDMTFGNPARDIEAYLTQPIFHPDPGFFGDLFRAAPPMFSTYTNPEFNRVQKAVITIHVGLENIDAYALGPVFRSHPEFARDTLDAIAVVGWRLAEHLRARRGLEASHLRNTTGLMLKALARRRAGY